eukprot:m.1260503 g.1260503  ORF g.1260503 m.1260503 type:complete len:392 (-) comp24727_c0_seq12:2762-3937(-)
MDRHALVVKSDHTSGTHDALIDKDVVSSPTQSSALKRDPAPSIAFARRICRYYGYEPRTDPMNASRMLPPRRIFWGSILGDDPRDVIQAGLQEIAGLVHLVAYSTSNLTQAGFRRADPYTPGSSARSWIESLVNAPVVFGSYIEYPINETLSLNHWNHIHREAHMRDVILKLWAEHGMQPDDVGVVADMDESFSRKFMHAMQMCRIPQFEPTQGCAGSDKPKVVAKTLNFNGSPYCIRPDYAGFHPDAILGKCVKGIGAPWGTASDVLWDAWDYRMRDGGRQNPANKYNAFHIHNFFDNASTLRFKYKTYGEKVPDADTRPIHSLHYDLAEIYKCLNTTDTASFSKALTPDPTSQSVQSEHDLPVFFDFAYAQRRHRALVQLWINAGGKTS